MPRRPQSTPQCIPAYTGYNGERGHLLHFSAGGEYLGDYDFGWDVTPAASAQAGRGQAEHSTR